MFVYSSNIAKSGGAGEGSTKGVGKLFSVTTLFHYTQKLLDRFSGRVGGGGLYTSTGVKRTDACMLTVRNN